MEMPTSDSRLMSALPDTLYFRVIERSSPELPPGTNLPDGWRLDLISSRKERHAFYDTFENQAYQKGLLVVRKKGHIEVCSLDTGKPLADTAFSGTPASFFPDALPEGKAREMLFECSDIRAFIRCCSIDVMISSWRVLDDNQKTVAILNSESLHNVDAKNAGDFARFHSITPLKGYHRELARILQALPEPVDAYRIAGFRERYLHIIESCGFVAGGYSAKIRLQLDPEATIHENVRRLLQFATTVMKANEQGIRKEIDTEFLHDYRVALRRSRSILRQLVGVFDPHRTAWALAALRDLGKKTNRLRDNDVCLLEKEPYLGMLPPALKPALIRFFDDLSIERRVLHRQFCMHLSGTEYRKFMTDWEAFITEEALPDQELAPNSALPTKTVAAKAIRKAWKKVIAHGRRAGTKAADSELHELRIYCKRLRYLLEFFSSLFPPKAAHLPIARLKTLQENLGKFVDISVQLEYLLGRLESIDATKEGIGLAAAIGGLTSALYRELELARDTFSDTFSIFDDENTREQFDELLTSLK
jgi:CHAD domain-containing protein